MEYAGQKRGAVQGDEGEGDAAKNSQTGLEVRVPWNRQQGARKSPGGPLGKAAPLSGVLVGEEPLAGCTGGHGSEERLVFGGTGRRKGVMAGTLGTRNVKPPGDLPHGKGLGSRAAPGLNGRAGAVPC